MHGVLFNKGMSLLHHRLAKKGVDLRLPHYWYKHGDIVAEYWMPKQVQWPRPSEEQTYVYWGGPPPQRLKDDALQKEILAEIEHIRDEFGVDEGGIPRIIEEVYSYAPFEFQRSFKVLFGLLREWYRPGAPIEKFIAEKFRPHFEKLVEQFPVETFPGLEMDFRKYVFVARTLLDKAQGVRYLLEGVSRDFWLRFCKSLRLDPKAHENIPSSTIEIWEEERLTSLELFSKQLRHWVTMSADEGRISRFREIDVQNWLFPEAWGPESRDSSTTIDETVYG